jgi:nitrite reductase/ring-hydroxylating ferredoxin subunit
MSEASKRIALKSVARNKVNVFEMAPETALLAFYDRDEIKIVRDRCPHMGGPLGKGKLSSCQRTLTCPWHGYKFSTATLTVIENPNEITWAKPLGEEVLGKYKPPQYRLSKVNYRLESDTIVLDDV